MELGLDYTNGPPPDKIKAAGRTFVCRYVGYFQGYDISKIDTPQGKVLTPSEARANSQAGIATVSNYEWTAERALQGPSAGSWDAQTADKIHRACGGPPTRPIYFSVDFNAIAAQTPAIISYFKGVASVIGLGRTGAYGPYEVIKALFDAGAITWGWQTYAWSNGQWDERAHIQQYQNSQTLAGASVDYDRSMQSDFGQWFVGGSIMGIPQGWTDDGHTLVAPNGNHVVLGFRDWIVNHLWDAGNEPLGPEFYPPQVQLHNTSLGPGSVQLFRDNLLWYTSEKGIIQEPFLGLELDAAYKLIVSLQDQLAKAQTTTVNVAQLRADIEAIIDALPPLFAKALSDLPKQ